MKCKLMRKNSSPIKFQRARIKLHTLEEKQQSEISVGWGKWWMNSVEWAIESAFLRAKFRLYTHRIPSTNYKVVRNSEWKSSSIPICNAIITFRSNYFEQWTGCRCICTICSGKISVEKMFDLTQTNDRAISHAEPCALMCRYFGAWIRLEHV